MATNETRINSLQARDAIYLAHLINGFTEIDTNNIYFDKDAIGIGPKDTNLSWLIRQEGTELKFLRYNDTTLQYEEITSFGSFFTDVITLMKTPIASINIETEDGNVRNLARAITTGNGADFGSIDGTTFLTTLNQIIKAQKQDDVVALPIRALTDQTLSVTSHNIAHTTPEVVLGDPKDAATTEAFFMNVQEAGVRFNLKIIDLDENETEYEAFSDVEFENGEGFVTVAGYQEYNLNPTFSARSGTNLRIELTFASAVTLVGGTYNSTFIVNWGVSGGTIDFFELVGFRNYKSGRTYTDKDSWLYEEGYIWVCNTSGQQTGTFQDNIARWTRLDKIIDNLTGTDISIDDSSLSNVNANNVQELASQTDDLWSIVNALPSGGGTGPNIGAITPFTGDVTVTGTNFANFDNEVALYVQQNDERHTFILPADSVITAANGFPATISILHQGGTQRITTGSIFDGPNNTIRVDVAGANNIRRGSDTGTLLNFAQVFRNDFATFTKEDAQSPWVFRSSTLSSGALLLPDGLFNLPAGATARFSTASQFIILSGGQQNPVIGDAYRVTSDDATFAGYGVQENDVIVALVNNPSRARNSANEDWLIIRNAHNNTISLTELGFLNLISETDIDLPNEVIDDAEIWLLDARPTAAPLLADAVSRVGTYKNTTSSNLVDKIVLFAVNNQTEADDLIVEELDTDGNSIRTYAFGDRLIDYGSVIADNTNGSYYILGSTVDSQLLYNLAINHTIRITTRQQRRTYKLGTNADLTQNITNLRFSQLEPSVQAEIRQGMVLTAEQIAKLDGLQVNVNNDPIDDNDQILIGYGGISLNFNSYQRIANAEPIIPQYDTDSTVQILVPHGWQVTGLRKSESTSTTTTVSFVATLSANGTTYEHYQATIPHETAPTDILDNAWQIVGTKRTYQLDGAVNSFQVHVANLAQDVRDLIPSGNQPVPTVTLPDVLHRLSNDLTAATTTASGWRALRSPIASMLTREAAAFWDENRRTFTGNYFSDIADVEVIGYTANEIFFYNDGNRASNTAFPDHDSFVENDNIRIRNSGSGTNIQNVFNKVIGFDYSLQRRIEANENFNMLRLGMTATTPIMGLSHDEGLYLNIGRADGGTQSRTYDSFFQVDNGQWHNPVGVSELTEAEVIIPQNLSGSLTVKIAIHLDDNGNDEGTHEETITITNLNNDQNIGTRTFDWVVSGTTYNITVDFRYDAVNNDLSTARRVLFLDPTQALNNAAFTYSIQASRSITETWSTSTTYARYPINAGSGHDRFGLFDPELWNTEQVRQPQNVLLALTKWVDTDTSSDPEVAVLVIVDGESHGQPSNNNKIRLHRPLSDFNTSDINVGNNICAAAHVQMYRYNENVPMTNTQLQTLYRGINSWLGAFTNATEVTDRFVLDANLELASGRNIIMTDTSTNTRKTIEIDDDDILIKNA